MAPTILIADDERDIVTTLEFAMGREGWTTLAALDGHAALVAARRAPGPDLIVLDVMLPDVSGVEVCRQLRNDEHTREIPIIMLTARDEEIDRVVGFEVGADDYVTKPFSVRELLLRIKAILRRVDPSSGAPAGVSVGCLRIDAITHRIWVEEREVKLTSLEFRLLTTMVARGDRLQTREELLRDVWGHAPGLHTRTLDTHLGRLRKKLGRAGAYIHTLRGAGYRFEVTNAG